MSCAYVYEFTWVSGRRNRMAFRLRESKTGPYIDLTGKSYRALFWDEDRDSVLELANEALGDQEDDDLRGLIEFISDAEDLAGRADDEVLDFIIDDMEEEGQPEYQILGRINLKYEPPEETSS